MSIKGLGTDIVQIARIANSLSRSDGLVKRVLTPNERDLYAAHAQPVRYFAKRFAAKEAVSKALGTGIGRGVSFQHIEISTNEDGAPQVELNAGALARAQMLGANQVLLSISDEKDYAMATAILSSD